MRKKIIQRGLLGFPLGIAIGYVISIFVSLAVGDGEYHPVAFTLVDAMGSEIAAVVLQAVLNGILGASFAIAAIIWEIDEWSIVKQTGIYFLATAAAILPIAYFSHWMERSLIGFAIYFGIFIAIFVVVWITQYFIWKNRIKGINKRIERN